MAWMLGLSLNYVSRTAPTYTAGILGIVDAASGYVTPADTGDSGLPASTRLSSGLLRDPSVGPLIIDQLHPSKSDRSTAPAGSLQPVTVQIARRQEGVADRLADLVGTEIIGQEAELWEIGDDLGGTAYTLPTRKIWRRGVVSDFDFGTEIVTITIQAPGTGLSDRALERWRGFGNGLLFAAGGTARVDTGFALDPAADFTVSSWVLFPVERWDSTWTGVIASNADVELRFNDRTVVATVAHATTPATVTSPDLPRPERFYMLRLKYTASSKTVELFVDGVSRGTSAGTGAKTASATNWFLGSTPTPSNYLVGIAGEWRIFDGTVADDDSDEQESGPLIGDETSLYAYFPGWTNIAGTSLFDYAEANSGAPKNGTITGATVATLLGGNTQEPRDDSDGDPEAAEGAQKNWPIGRCTHVLGRGVDSEGKVFVHGDPDRGIQDFRKVYQGGVEESITFRVTSWLALYAASLGSAGDCAVYPQGCATRHHTLTEGSITSDVLGAGPSIRSLSLDGVNDSVTFSTGLASLFTASFTIHLELLIPRNSGTGSQAVLGDLDDLLANVPNGILIEWHQPVATDVENTLGFSIIDNSDLLTLNCTAPRREDLSVVCAWAVTVTGGTVSAELFVNGEEVASGSKSLTLAASVESLYLGRMTPAFVSAGGTANWLKGFAGDLRIYTEAKTLAWHQRTLHAGAIGRLDAGGVAIDESGGLVSLAAENHQFAAGESVDIAGTTNYNATKVLHANTTEDRLWITATFNAETFDGFSESVKDSTMAHAYPGRTWDFDASTLADEGTATAADGTISGATWVGGITPATLRSMVVFVAKHGGQKHARFDLTKTYDWPSSPVDWSGSE